MDGPKGFRKYVESSVNYSGQVNSAGQEKDDSPHSRPEPPKM